MTGNASANTVAACVERTRSMVLNVMILTGLGIASSGFLLRWRDSWAESRAPRQTGPWLLIALCVVVAASHLSRRWICGRSSLNDPATRFGRFVRGHVVSALIGALAIPLGMVYGWFVRPTLDAVAPFWIAGLAIGFLSLPRTAELDDFEEPIPPVPFPNESEREPTEPMIS